MAIKEPIKDCLKLKSNSMQGKWGNGEWEEDKPMKQERSDFEWAGQD